MKLLNNIKNKKGSSTILLAMVFVTLMTAIIASIEISRALVIKSECESFGHLWEKSILSEYDKPLLKEYGIMAYFGNELEIQKKLNAYLNYSANSKLDAGIIKTSSELMGYQLVDPKNFREALKNGFVSSAVDSIIDKGKREKRDRDSIKSREIKNNIVIDTLPSQGVDNTVDVNAIVDKLKNENILDTLLDGAKTGTTEIAFIKKYMGNQVTSGNGKAGYFTNEWEYILSGKLSDKSNFSSCKNKIFLIRNALNLAYLYKDPEKRAIIISIAETLSPGVAGVLTQAIIAETWAAIETEKDMDTLLDNGRVPFMKTATTWKTGIESILNSKEITGQLSQEGIDLLNKNREDIEKMDGASAGSEIKDGQNYDDYLIAMIMMLNDNVKLLRIMDIIQINMKYWYYRDFNMMEYYTSVAFSIKSNGKNYDFKDSYK